MKQSVIFHALLVGLLLLSAVALVFVQHRHRALYVELQSLERERDALEVEWGKLQLEESTRLAQDNIELKAKKELAMRIPAPEDVVVVTR